MERITPRSHFRRWEDGHGERRGAEVLYGSSMEDSFFVTDSEEEMSRAFDPHNLDVPPSAAPPITPVRRSVPSHPVCPFCGTINETAGAPCRQCGMENSQATRAATRAKLGPWYVWQAKNPAAPGMNFATLLNLIERGRVTPRSIVRGPTTHQLWRYAARVKGLSREFGACWGCGAEVTKTSRVCSACKRLQQPPINPDVLLETGDAAQTASAQPSGDSYSAAPASHSPAPAPHAQDFPAPSAPTAAPALDPPLARTRPMPARATMQAHFVEMPPPSSLPVVDMGDAPMGEGMELAAFNLPREYRDGAKPIGRRVFKGILLAFLLAAISFAVMLYFNPGIAPKYSAWMRAAVAKVMNLFSSDSTPERSKKPAQESSSGAVVTSVTTASTSSAPAGGIAGTMPAPPAPSNVAALAPGEGTAATPAHPAPKVTEPAKLPTEMIVISPASIDPAVAVKQAWDWHSAAISAEQRDDYATAVKHYEAINNLHLPEGVGPTDVQSRLANARLLMRAPAR